MQSCLGLIKLEMDVSFLFPNVEAVAINAGEKQTRARNSSSTIFRPELVEGGNLTRATD